MPFGFLKDVLSAPLSAIGGHFKGKAQQKQAQQQQDLAMQMARNTLESKYGGRVGEIGAAKSRMLGNLPGAGSYQTVEGGYGGKPFKVFEFDPTKFFSGLGGKFGEDLRSTTPSDIRGRFDFSSPKVESGRSFWGDLLTGLGGGLSRTSMLDKMYGGDKPSTSGTPFWNQMLAGFPEPTFPEMPELNLPITQAPFGEAGTPFVGTRIRPKYTDWGSLFSGKGIK